VNLKVRLVKIVLDGAFPPYKGCFGDSEKGKERVKDGE